MMPLSHVRFFQRNRKYLQGLSLIEVLVAGFIFSTGILGISSITLVSLNMNSNTEQHVQAEMLANNHLETIRANRDEVGEFHTDKEAANEQAQDLKNQWNEELARTLPNGKGKVKIKDQRVKIEVTWDSVELGNKNESDSKNKSESKNKSDSKKKKFKKETFKLESDI